MKTFSDKGLEWYQFGHLSDHSGLMHAITSRKGGYSLGNYASLNLGLKSGDNPALVQKNQNKLQKTLNIPDIVFPDQCHTAISKIVTRENFNENFATTDALITAEPSLCIGVLTADCVPILLYDSIKRIVAAIHGGWRGIIKGIIPNTIKMMTTEFGSKPQNLKVGIGPSISQKNYEVGPEVVQAFKKEFNHPTDLLSFEDENGHAYLDLWVAVNQQLIHSGLEINNIETSSMCTYDLKGTFFSARRDGYHTGRFASIIMLKPHQ